MKLQVSFNYGEWNKVKILQGSQQDSFSRFLVIIFLWHESIYREKEIFGANKIIIITQKYHLYRSLYIAKRLGLEGYGVGADPRRYRGEIYRESREIVARNKDFVKCVFKSKPKYLGDSIPLSGNGDVTNDK